VESFSWKNSNFDLMLLIVATLPKMEWQVVDRDLTARDNSDHKTATDGHAMEEEFGAVLPNIAPGRLDRDFQFQVKIFT
jgi:hypothetical protein